MTRKNQIGFSQRIQLPWLEHTASLVLAGQGRGEIERSLQRLLQNQLSVGGTAKRGTREKAITILMKIWVTVPDGLEDLRNKGLELLQRLPHENHLCVHWGMAMAVYPFWGHVAASTGRLLRLQGTVSAGQVQRRMRERYGERETVSRAARRILRAFVDWGVLLETGRKGVYRAAERRRVADRQLATWLIEATLVADGATSRPLEALLQSPALFPFQLGPLTSPQLAPTGCLDVVRHADGEWVELITRGA